MVNVKSQIANQIITLIEIRKSRLDAGIYNGRRALRGFVSDLPDIAFAAKDFEITKAIYTLSLALRLLNNYFEQRVQRAILENIDSEKYYFPASTKAMLKREIYGLDVDRHFDGDYILLFEKVRDDFTTFKSLEKFGSEELRRKTTKSFLEIIYECSEPIIKDINKKVNDFFVKSMKTLTENPSTTAFREEVEKFTILLHREVYGWP